MKSNGFVLITTENKILEKYQLGVRSMSVLDDVEGEDGDDGDDDDDDGDDDDDDDDDDGDDDVPGCRR